VKRDKKLTLALCVASPFPLVCIATGASVLMLGFILVRNRSITNPSICKLQAAPKHSWLQSQVLTILSLP
jgi:hypothetical protein